MRLIVSVKELPIRINSLYDGSNVNTFIGGNEMQPRLNVLGRKYNIIQRNYDENGTSMVIYEDVAEDGVTKVKKIVYDLHSELGKQAKNVQVNLKSFIEDDSRVFFEQLMQYLEDMYKSEQHVLTDLAIELAETRAELPFDSVGHLLVQKQNEYFLMQQRVLGIEDAISEVQEFYERHNQNEETERVVNDKAVIKYPWE